MITQQLYFHLIKEMKCQKHAQRRLNLFRLFLGVSAQTEQKQPQQDRKGVSVIQHTSSFEKQESISAETPETDPRESEQTQPPEPKPSPSTSRLIRQPNIQVPEILVTEDPDADMPSVSPPVTASLSKVRARLIEVLVEKREIVNISFPLQESDKPEEFQWPQRSQTLAQLPAEKLPPKKKRLRLAEAARSSGESSFESVSLPRSPSQESSVSHTPSLPLYVEETAKSERALWASSSQSSQMLMVPSISYQYHQSHKEMRRSASEQTPPSPQQTEQVSEPRSKSFDYGSLSHQQPASSWKEKRKCLLVKYATLGEPEQEEGTSMGHLSRVASPKPGPSHAIPQPVYSPEPCSRFSAEAAVQPLLPQIAPPPQSLSPSRLQGHQSLPRGTLSQLLPVTTDVLSTQILPRTLLDSQRVPPPIQIRPAPFHLAGQFSHIPSLVPLQFAPRSRRTGETLYLPFPPRLAAHVSSVPITESRPASASVSSVLPHHSLVTISDQHPRPVIATCLTQFSPIVSLVVPVRHQTHRPTYAGAMYTALSQILASTHSQEPIPCTGMVIVSSLAQSKQQQTYLKVPSSDTRSLLPLTWPTELASGSGEGYGPLGVGGSKRMLSPAASLELSTEAQRHQKRVKEEEEEEEHTSREEEEDAQKALPEEGESKLAWEKLEGGEEEQAQRVEPTVKGEEAQERVPRKDAAEEKEARKSTEKTNKKDKVPVVQQQIGRANAPTYPSLHTSTTVNWCYLNYVKPNPSALRDPGSSVYSTWSISAHNPNLPGLSTKVALSLLCSKQKHSSETYTMAMAPTPAKTEATPESSSTQKVAEVNIVPIKAPGPAVPM